MRTLRALALALSLLLLPAAAPAAFDPARMHEKYAAGEFSYHMMGTTGVQLRDVDGMPGDEVLIGYTSMWHLLKWDSRTQSFAQLGFHENGIGEMFGGGGILVVRFGQLEGHPLEVAMLDVNGQVSLFSLDGTLRATWKVLALDIQRIRLADLDGTPGDEVLVQTCKELSAWRFGATTPLWRIPVDRCQNLVLDQFDSDPQLEIALESGVVYDTKTLQQQWRYPIGFGATMASADLNGDGIRDLVTCRERQCDGYDVAARENLWESFVPYPYDVRTVTAGDVDGDGRAEVFAGDSQLGFMRKMNGLSGEELAQFAIDGPANFVAVGNLDGDCQPELLWAKDYFTNVIDTLHVTDPREMKALWESIPMERDSSGISFADFSGTGRPGLLWSKNGGFTLRFFGFAPSSRSTREILRLDTGYAYPLPVIAAAQFDADPAAEYVTSFTPTDIDQHTIHVYDGATHRLEWSAVVTPDTISSMTAGDLTGDGVPEIVVGATVFFFAVGHPEAVVVVDGATHRVLWRSQEEMPAFATDDCRLCVAQVAIHDLDLDGTKEVLALVPQNGLYAYNGRTGALLWHRSNLAYSWSFTVADVDPSPGAEIIIPFFGQDDHGRIGIYDATGQKLLREKSLGDYGTGWAAQAADLDGDGNPELAVVTKGGLLILSAQTLDTLWSGGVVFPGYAYGNQILVADVDGDGTPEVVVPSAHSLRLFEYRNTAADGYPPSFLAGETRATALATACCGLNVQWPAATDTESMPVRYRVYRSEVPDFRPDPTTLLAETPLQNYLDGALHRGHIYYYAITALDGAGNETTSPLRASAAAPPTCVDVGKVRAIRPH